ncbi:hypothetical protein BCR37DRAFT_1659 [Protomyces lactucae-debilis]|uniref:Large ribosomal subunit protein mL59 domain-containing protein n=1 Tax=Protomyces lactucae-debilis TaxID=2754530 RepID=A0A1Y2FUG4_PROLT|nr:uncharacterized protein BCR37DRAFT_1659 [Protomyces lactucae-debilis]ORY87589.1 hypothetical protein BCR37DRAFT_1659 [Protomyces lactucae-debilis]
MSSLQARQAVARLPRPLLNFFKAHPPASSTSWSSKPSADKITQTASTESASPAARPRANPFQPSKNTYTLRFNEPRYSIRRQQDLLKLAQQYQIAHLLPETMKQARIAKALAKSKTLDVEGNKVKTPMRGLVKWKGTKMERTRHERRETIQAKLATARSMLKARKARTKVKHAKARKVR